MLRLMDGRRRESRVEEKKGKKKEACQPMFSESVYSASRKPVTSCRNDLIAVCWPQTNHGIDMCALSLGTGEVCRSVCFTIPKLHNTKYGCMKTLQTVLHCLPLVSEYSILTFLLGA